MHVIFYFVWPITGRVWNSKPVYCIRSNKISVFSRESLSIYLALS